MPESQQPLRITFPHLGDYQGIVYNMLELTGCEIVLPPPITRRTLELGSKHAPESVCVPFKYNLGNYLEAIELGANAFFTSAGGCRLDYYAEVHQQILRDLGHKLRMFRLQGTDFLGVLREINPQISRLAFIRHFSLVLRKLKFLDALGDIMRKRMGFELQEGVFENWWSGFLKRLKAVRTHGAFNSFTRQTRAELLALPVAVPERPLRVGVIGELYVIMEPASNFGLERRLAAMGVELHRWVTASSILHHGMTGARTRREHLRYAQPYAKYHIGAHGTESIARVHQMINAGFDGAVHLKPFGCMPEINALPALHRMCREHRFPLMTLSFDSHTAESGVTTRLEAFYDMIASRRQGGLLCANAI